MLKYSRKCWKSERFTLLALNAYYLMDKYVFMYMQYMHVHVHILQAAKCSFNLVTEGGIMEGSCLLCILCDNVSCCPLFP